MASASAAAPDDDPWQPVSPWAVCPPPLVQDFHPTYRGDPEQAPAELEARHARRDPAGNVLLLGEAAVIRADMRLLAEQIRLDRTEERLDARDGVRIDRPGLTLRADHGSFWLTEQRGILYETRFNYHVRHGRGRADSAELLEPGVTRLEDVRYTTCAEGNKDWTLRARRITLDQNKGIGEARHVRLQVGSIPVLYAPYFSFPIDSRRKSGFLLPGIGSSRQSGLEISTPYYVNLAPNYDLTLTPRYLSRRGGQMNTEFRYLRRRGGGTVNHQILPEDDETGQSRNRFTLRDTSRFGHHVTTHIDYDRVSDPDYILDLGNSLDLSSVTHLKRSASVDYAARWLRASAWVDDYQTVDRSIAAADRPYERLPAVELRAENPWQPLGVKSALRSSFVAFDQDSRVTAQRIDLQPEIRRSWVRDAYEITPRIGLRHTRYRLDNQDPGVSGRQSRTTPIASLDTKLFLERGLELGGRHLTHTLEPRLRYLYIGGQNQQDIPLFDTTEPVFSYRELFADNRFRGVDRMGDANQLALALSSRVLDPASGAQLFRASIGELFYFANRNVGLENTGVQRRNRSSIASEMELALGRSWSGKAELVWDPYDEQTERGNIRLQYNPGHRRIANLSYRFLRRDQSQLDASFLWPLGPRWQAMGRWYYDFNATQELETLAGIEYDSCCWGIRLVVRDYVVRGREDTNRSIMFQFVFKGLGHVGSNIGSILENGILGYTERPWE